MCPPFSYPREVTTTARIDASHDELLRAVYVRAAAALGVGVDAHVAEFMGDADRSADVGDVLAYLRFAENDSAAAQRSNLQAHDLEIVDPDGTISFGRNLDDTTVADLVRTSEAGLLPGDVRRPYFVPYVPGGGIEPWFLSWPTLLGAVSVASSLLALAANIDGVLGLIERIGRLTRGSAALRDTAMAIEARKGRPDVLYELLGRRPWAPADLGARLDVSADAAIAILEVFGFEEAEPGLWRRGTSTDAEFLRLLLDEIIVSGNKPPGSTGDSFEDRVRYLISQGERAPMPEWMSGDSEGFDEDEDEDDNEDPTSRKAPSDPEQSEDGADFEPWPDPAEPIRCRCADTNCVVQLTISGGSHEIELVFSSPTGHFVAPSEQFVMRSVWLEKGN